MTKKPLFVPGRAETPDSKAVIVARVLDAWRMCPHQRLGQLIANALHAAEDNAFYVEDEDLAEALEEFALR